MIEGCIACFNLAVTNPTNLSLQYDYPTISDEWWDYFSAVLTAYTMSIVLIIEACRIWLISYDLQYLHSSKNQKWKTVIDTSYAEMNWYLQNRGKWGNQQYVIKLGFIYYIITSTAVPVMTFVITPIFDIHHIYVFVLQGACLFVPVTIPIYLFVTTPRNLRDQFLFFYEFTWLVIIVLSGILLAIICFALIWFGYWTLGWAVAMMEMIYSCVPSLLSTIWIPWKVHLMKEWDDGRRITALDLDHSPGDFRETLQAILIDEQKCEAFIDWLQREFSGEVILSFLEFLQFRKFVKDEIGKTDGMYDTGDMDPYDFALYDAIPQSTIVYDTFRIDEGNLQFSAVEVSSPSAAAKIPSTSDIPENPLMRCKRIAHLLFKKYIDYHSEHEINISAKLRNKYFHRNRVQYKTMGLEQFVTLFDDPMAEMMQYQSQSYMRFQRAHRN